MVEYLSMVADCWLSFVVKLLMSLILLLRVALTTEAPLSEEKHIPISKEQMDSLVHDAL